MKLAIISENKEWRRFLSSFLDLPTYQIDLLKMEDLTLTEKYDLIFFDLELVERELVPPSIFKIRVVLGWGPHLLTASPNRGYSQQDLRQTLQAGADDIIEDANDKDAIFKKAIAIVRRRYFDIVKSKENIKYSVQNKKRFVYVDGNAVKLDEKEFEVFVLLYGNVNEIVDRSIFYKQIWNDLNAQRTRALDRYVSRIRRRLSLDGSYGLRIKSIHGVGYILKIEGC